MDSISLLIKGQFKAINHLISHKSTFLIADLGVGKTIITLCALKYLLDTNKIKKVLILGPLDVVTLVWPLEIDNWSEIKNLDCVLVRGSAKRRVKLLEEPHQIYLLNYENFAWLGEWLKKNCIHKTQMTRSRRDGRVDIVPGPDAVHNPFDVVVFDESLKMASISNNRYKVWKDYFHSFKYRIALTATPRPNTAQSLYGQTYILDSGKTFGHSFEKFNLEYFYPTRNEYVWRERPDTNERIYDKIKHLIFRLKGKDRPYDLEDIELKLTSELQKQYNDLEKRFFIELEEKTHVLPSKLVSWGKCNQFVGGNIYLDNKEIDSEEKRIINHIHDIKLEALKKLIADKTQNHSLIIVYEFNHEREELKMLLPELVVFNQTDKRKTFDLWNAGKIKYLAVHPKSASEGLNLQHGGFNMVFYTTPYSRYYFDQLPGRINRTGQTKKVKVYRLLMLNTIDVVKREVLRTRGTSQDNLINTLMHYKKGKS